MTIYNPLYKTFFATLLAFILNVALIQITYAATPSNDSTTISLSPVSKNYKLDPGKTEADFVTITNNGDTTFTFKLTAEPYSIKNASYEPDYFTVRKNTDIKSWISFEQTMYTLEPKVSVKVPYRILTPNNANPGGHYGVIFAEIQPEKVQTEQTSLRQKSRVGMVVYSTVSGEYKMGGNVLSIRTPSLQFKSPLKSEVNVENTGNSDFPVETIFAVSDILGNRKHTATNTYQMLPGTERRINLAWDKSPGFGLYEVITSVKFLDKKESKTSYVLMAPISYYMIFIIGIFVAVIYFISRKR